MRVVATYVGFVRTMEGKDTDRLFSTTIEHIVKSYAKLHERGQI